MINAPIIQGTANSAQKAGVMTLARSAFTKVPMGARNQNTAPERYAPKPSYMREALVSET